MRRLPQKTNTTTPSTSADALQAQDYITANQRFANYYIHHLALPDRLPPFKIEPKRL